MTDKEIVERIENILKAASEMAEANKMYPKSLLEGIYPEILEFINRQQEQLDAAISGQETLQKALADKGRKVERLTAEKEQLIKTFGECQERAVKDFAKAVVDGIDEGYISHASDIVDFTHNYLRGKGYAE